jgi:hypothetical protein
LACIIVGCCVGKGKSFLSSVGVADWQLLVGAEILHPLMGI